MGSCRLFISAKSKEYVSPYFLQKIAQLYIPEVSLYMSSRD